MPAQIITIVVCASCGAANGLFVAVMGIDSFVATTAPYSRSRA